MEDPTANKIEGLTFAQYLTRVALKLEQRSISAGQAYFIILQELHPEWALQIAMSLDNELDPFHDDKKIPLFLSHVCTMWGAKGGVVFHHGTPMSKGRPV